MGLDAMILVFLMLSFPGGPVVKNLPANAGSIPGLGRSPGEGNGNSLQYSCLENSMDRGAWQTIVHGVTKSWTQLSSFHKRKIPHRTLDHLIFQVFELDVLIYRIKL